MLVELLGVVATLFIILAFMQDRAITIRVLDLVGAILFIIYGILISSFSTILLNFILSCIQVYKIRQLRKEQIE